MTTKEAIKHFQSLQKRYTTEHNGKMCEKVALALEAMEKQVPKKPYEKYEYMGNIGYGLNPMEYIKGYVCPTCGEWLEEGDHHCPCGQALLWEDTE